MYPHYPGCRLQLAFCLMQRGDYPQAEIQCWSARALGASLAVMGAGFLKLTGMQTRDDARDALANRAPNPGSKSVLQDPPTIEDVEKIVTILGVMRGARQPDRLLIL